MRYTRSAFRRCMNILIGAYVAALVLAVGCGGSSTGSEPGVENLAVDISWLQSRLDEGGLRIIDARASSEDFEAGHVPGAERLDPYEIASEVDGIPVQVMPPEAARSLLAERGVRPGDTIVVYGNPPEYDPTRVVWALRYYGYRDVRYLDGGWPAWQEAGFEVESGPANPSGDGRLPDATEEDLRVTGDWVLAQLGEPPYDDSTIQVLDARSAAEYEAGRIPTAIHRRWTINLDNGLLLPVAELEELYSDLDKTKTTVVYCLAGWRASLSWLVLESLGFEDVRVYDGSWFEWGPPSRFPIETDD